MITPNIFQKSIFFLDLSCFLLKSTINDSTLLFRFQTTAPVNCLKAHTNADLPLLFLFRRQYVFFQLNKKVQSNMIPISYSSQVSHY